MIFTVNSQIWSALENRLTPLHSSSKNWRLFHHMPALALLPVGLATLTCETAYRFLASLASYFTSDPRDPKKDFTAICDDSRKWAKLDSTDVSFDPNFLFGTATCTWQDSGAQNCPESQWSEWEKHVVSSDNQSGKSADFFGLYQTKKGRCEVVERLQKLGCNSYRFSIEWSHIEPKKGQFNDKNLETYVELCKQLRKAGIEPMVTLHHFSEPKWFHEEGSFEKEENIAYFLRFAKHVYPKLTQNTAWLGNQPLVNFICTFNEPGVEAFSRYVRGAFSPGYKFGFQRAGKFLHGMLKAHSIAYRELKKMNPHAQVGITHQRLVLKTSNPLIRPVVHVINRLVNETTLNFFKTGVFSYRIPFSSNLYEEGLNPKTDFVGVQYYARPVIGLTGSTSYHEPMTEMPFREDPEGLYEAIIETHDAFKVPVFITENGISTHNSEQRERYLSRALYATKKAQEKIGAKNLRGYYMWSMSDNAEWDMGMKPQSFGAYTIGEDGRLSAVPKKGTEPFTTVARRSRGAERETA